MIHWIFRVRISRLQTLIEERHQGKMSKTKPATATTNLDKLLKHTKTVLPKLINRVMASEDIVVKVDFEIIQHEGSQKRRGETINDQEKVIVTSKVTIVTNDDGCVTTTLVPALTYNEETEEQSKDNADEDGSDSDDGQYYDSDVSDTEDTITLAAIIANEGDLWRNRSKSLEEEREKLTQEMEDLIQHHKETMRKLKSGHAHEVKMMEKHHERERSQKMRKNSDTLNSITYDVLKSERVMKKGKRKLYNILKHELEPMTKK